MAVAKSEKPGAIERSKRYIRGLTQEMKRVHWPSRRDTMLYTAAVVAVSLVMALLIYILDSGVGALMGFLLNLGR